jgi:hypothetical protein
MLTARHIGAVSATLSEVMAIATGRHDEEYEPNTGEDKAAAELGRAHPAPRWERVAAAQQQASQWSP